jgi:hypothetical protein
VPPATGMERGVLLLLLEGGVTFTRPPPLTMAYVVSDPPLVRGSSLGNNNKNNMSEYKNNNNNNTQEHSLTHGFFLKLRHPQESAGLQWQPGMTSGQMHKAGKLAWSSVLCCPALPFLVPACSNCVSSSTPSPPPCLPASLPPCFLLRTQHRGYGGTGMRSHSKKYRKQRNESVCMGVEVVVVVVVVAVVV